MQSDTLQTTITDSPDADSRRAQKQRHNDNKLAKRLIRETGRAINDFNMIENGDKVMVCLSGGKDSYSLLDILLTLKARAPIDFDIIAVNLDQKQPGFPDHILPEYLRGLGVPFHIETQDTYSIVTRVIPEGKTMCSLCSRLRRGILYRVASELGATKIALGHHRDDILGTFFLNLFYGGRMKAMPPKLMSDDGKHIVIRPLAYVPEKDLISYAQYKQFPIIPCNLCGSQENLKRKEVTRMIAEWDRSFPGRSWNIFGALSRVVPTHLMDRELFDFVGITANGESFENGDKAFDAEDFDVPPPSAAHLDDDAPDNNGGLDTLIPRIVARSRHQP
ncbi:tRNA 2-thiocytidine(32) synthetase TtcA [Allopusillimonas ginsengisoli]|uniref:tRNA 2-thiocytidine(32) synthetase TtcA n=1 Tax=Allopusillimonas ginsengisoli TaxID=453575 RepID=UPI001020111E|nr:tRNA 2-thiocytidine(32) synthetase TtcA [Allopusillimonas ginsengisoli]TEA79209.1 tRNA 2-thiocytidine(32) synthetase TtcA [Allopusillimonas ginsengisoli]